MEKMVKQTMSSKPNAQFWKDKKVFLTGHTGFKGSWMSLWLQKMGAEVTGYALAPIGQSLFNDANVAKGMNSVIANICDLELLKKTLQHVQPEIVIHMAAQPLVRYSYEAPVETYMTNVMGCVNLFEAIRETSSVKTVVNVTSDKCYENIEQEKAYIESDPMGGYDPYSSSKGCAELVTAAYRRSYFQKQNVALASARAGNVIGGGDWALDRLFPDVIRALLKNEIVKIRNPKAVRPWQHVLEPLCGYLVLAEKLHAEGQKYAQAFNFGPRPEDIQNVETVVKKYTQVWDKNAQYEIVDSGILHEAHLLMLDSQKAHAVLNWHPHWSLDKALQKIAEWVRVYQNNKNNIHEMTLSQISEYEK